MKYFIALLAPLALAGCATVHTAEIGADHPAHPAAAEAAAPVYTCPMHPEVRSDQPGKCPKCKMELELAKPAAGEHAHGGGEKMACCCCAAHAGAESGKSGMCPMCKMHAEGGKAGAHEHKAEKPAGEGEKKSEAEKKHVH